MTPKGNSYRIPNPDESAFPAESAIPLAFTNDEDLLRQLICRMSGNWENPDRPGLKDTPARVVASWRELFFGYVPNETQWVKDLLTEFDEPGADEMVVVRAVRVYSFCEHHLLPFVGTAAVGYLPRDGKVLGLSKLARLVQFYSARLSTQERICAKVADALSDVYGSPGVGCVVRASHLCMCARGARETESETVTSALRGKFKTEPWTRSEFLRLSGV